MILREKKSEKMPERRAFVGFGQPVDGASMAAKRSRNRVDGKTSLFFGIDGTKGTKKREIILLGKRAFFFSFFPSGIFSLSYPR